MEVTFPEYEQKAPWVCCTQDNSWHYVSFYHWIGALKLKKGRKYPIYTFKVHPWEK